jgi:hypothetical protein
MALDPAENIILTGNYYDSVDFDPDTGAVVLNAAGLTDIFISKLDSAGHLIWAKSIGGHVYDYVRSLDTDNSGSIYLTGSFMDTVDFNPDAGINTLVSNGNFDVFVLKLNSAGNFVWAKSFGGESPEVGRDLFIKGKTVYCTGGFQSTVDFDPDGGIYDLSSTGMYDIYISELDTDGSFLCAGAMGGSDDDFGTSICLTADNMIYTAGAFYHESCDMDPTASDYNLSAHEGYNMYIAAYSPCGQAPTSTEDPSQPSSFSISPNPTAGRFIIRTTAPCTYSIYDMLGKCIMYSTIPKTIAEADLSNFTKGVYMIRISSEKKSFSEKILVGSDEE